MMKKIINRMKFNNTHPYPQNFQNLIKKLLFKKILNKNVIFVKKLYKSMK